MEALDNFQDIFGFSFLAENATERLAAISKEHPYFGLAQYYYLKAKWANKTYTNEDAAKTALHFNNLFLLNRRLNTENAPVYTEQVANEKTASFDQGHATQPDNIVPKYQQHEMNEEIQAAEPVIENKSGEMVTPLVEQEEQKDALLPIFQPLFTSDYFASQGIKLSENIQSDDKLGKQLRSFTGWLKTMKKLNTSYSSDSQRPLDISVQRLAENSNREEDVVTEAMAEAYLQQEKPEKAREVYQKLSLLNPDKSSYFAAQLEKIK